MTNVVLNGNAYSDDGSAARDMQGGGHRQWLLPMLGDAIIETDAAAGQAADAAGQAAVAAAQGVIDAVQGTVDAAQAVANYKGLWDSLTGAMNIPASVYHAGNFWILLANQANIAAVEPGVSAVWQMVNGWRTPLPVVRPTLLMEFAAAQVFDPRISFSRSSSATRVNNRGFIESVPAGVPRLTFDPINGACKGLLIGQAATNLFTYSDINQAGWYRSINLSCVDTVTAPDGSMTAVVYTTLSTGNAFVSQAVALAASTTYTMSVYARLVSGAVPTVGALLISDYDSGGAPGRSSLGWEGLSTQWRRFSLTFTNDAAITGLQFICTDFANGAKIAIWGAQIERGIYPSSFIPSADSFVSRSSVATYVGSNGLIQSAAANVARMGYNPLDLSIAPKLLLEPEAVNFLSYSEEFDQSIWVKSSATVTSNAATSPWGTYTADKLLESADNAAHSVYQMRAGSSETVTLSVFAKAKERNQVSLSFGNGATHSLRAFFDIANAKVLSIGPVNADYTAPMASIVAFGGGWFRCVLTVTKGNINTTNNVEISVANGELAAYAGSATSGIYIWGAQLQPGALADSYIYTGGGACVRASDVSSSAQTTRAADNVTLTGANATNWINPAEGTMLVAHSMESASAGVQEAFGFRIDDGSNGNNLSLRYYTIGGEAKFDATASANGAPQADTVQGAYPIRALVTHALSYKANDFAYARNGGPVEVASTFAVPYGLGVARIGSALGGSAQGEQCISRIAYYPERLPNAAIQALTAQ